MATWKSVGTSSVKLGSKRVTMHVARRGHDAKATFPPTGISLTVDPKKKTLLDIKEGHATKKEVHDALVIVNRMVGGEPVRAHAMRSNPAYKRKVGKGGRKWVPSSGASSALVSECTFVHVETGQRITAPCSNSMADVYRRQMLWDRPNVHMWREIRSNPTKKRRARKSKKTALKKLTAKQKRGLRGFVSEMKRSAKRPKRRTRR